MADAGNTPRVVYDVDAEDGASTITIAAGDSTVGDSTASSRPTPGKRHRIDANSPVPAQSEPMGSQRYMRHMHRAPSEADMVRSIAQLLADKEELQSKMADAQRNYDALALRNGELDRQNSHLRRKVEEVLRQNVDLKRRNSELARKIVDELVVKIDGLEQRVLQQHSDVEELQAGKTKLQHLLDDATHTAAGLARDLTALRGWHDAAMNRVDELTAFVDCCLGLLGQRVWCLQAEAWKGTHFEPPNDPPSDTDPLLETFLHVRENFIEPIRNVAVGALGIFKKLANNCAAGDNPKLPAAPTKELCALLPYAISGYVCIMNSDAEAEAARKTPTTVLAKHLVDTFGGESSPLWRTELRDLPDIPALTKHIDDVLHHVSGPEPDWQEAEGLYLSLMGRLEQQTVGPTICDEQEIAVLEAFESCDASGLRTALRVHASGRFATVRESMECSISAFRSSQLFNDGRGFSSSHLFDILCRARCLVQHLIDTDPKPKRVVTMDGHGRFVIAFLIMMWRAVADGELTSDYVDALEIQLVDVLSASIESHKALFFTERFIHTEANILDVAAQHHKDPSVLFYFNFCGLKSGCKDNLQQVRQWLTVAEVPFMVSMASTRCAQRTVMGFQSLVNNLPDRWASIEVGATQRKKTVQTWFMTPRVPPPHGARLDALDESSGLD